MKSTSQTSKRVPTVVRRLFGLGLVLVIAVALLRVFCLRIFAVETPSMEPTVHGVAGDFPGEHVLVRFGPLFDAAELERFDLVVIRRDAGGAPLCKRLIGLPGERLQFVDGDLFVNGERLPSFELPPLWIDVFDQARDAFDEHFHYSKAPESPWEHNARGELVLEGAAIPVGAELGMMLFQRELTDTVRLGDGSLKPGLIQVNDGRLQVEFQLLEELGEGLLRFRLVEAGDLFEVELREQDGMTQVTVYRRPGNEVLVSTTSVPLGTAWTRLTWENRDNHLALRLEAIEGHAMTQMATDYASNRSFGGLLPEGLSSLAPRVAFGGAGVRVAFRNVRIWRDLYWVATGDWGARAQIELGPDEYFAVGDNSANSLDSRHWGPLARHELMGRPVGVVAPGSTRRSL
jgi:signal peptidase I